MSPPLHEILPKSFQRIVPFGIISSCQSSATSEIAQRFSTFARDL